MAATLALAPTTAVWADVNPWIRSTADDPGRWDNPDQGTATPWLHPPPWTPDQGWGLFEGNLGAKNITGSWGGLRDNLVRDGIDIKSAYLGQFAANPVGGESQGQSWRGNLSVDLFADLDRLFDIRRSYVTASLSYDSGTTSLTPSHIGNVYPVQLSTSFDKHSLRLVHLAFGTQLFDGTVAVNGGRVIAGEQFATLVSACNSLNQGICGNPIAGARDVTFPTYPNAVWGANLEYKPELSWYAKTGAYLVQRDLLSASNGGVDFGLPEGAGPLVLGEIGYRSGIQPIPAGSGPPSSVRVEGTYKIGAYYDGEALSNLSSGEMQRHTWGLYAMGEHHVYKEKKDKDEGLWAWMALSYAPPDVNQIEFMVAGGLSYKGLIDGRSKDALSFNFASGVFSDRLEDQGAETLLELDYRLHALPSVYLEPNLQYIINPDGRSSIDNALVAGIALGFNF